VDVHQTVSIAATIDERFAGPLTVALRSACKGLSAGWSLRVFVVGYQVGPSVRADIEGRLEGLPIAIEWLGFDDERVSLDWPRIAAAGAVTHYYRLYLGEILPQSVERVLFLDADVLVEGDLAELWQSPFEGTTVQATPDTYAELLHLERLAPLKSYFNAGVLLIDLNRWRREDMGRRAREVLNREGAALTFRDQDALNLALTGEWKALPVAWNLHELPQRLGFWRCKERREDVSAAFKKPKIVHFVGKKPWQELCLNHFRGRWRQTAEEAGLYRAPKPSSQSRSFVLWHADPAELDWLLWRGLIHARDWSRAGQAMVMVLRRPWMLVTYPLWKIRIRVGRWKARRRRIREGRR